MTKTEAKKAIYEAILHQVQLSNEVFSLAEHLPKMEGLALVMLSEEEIISTWYSATNDAVDSIIESYEYSAADKKISEDDREDFLDSARKIDQSRPQNSKIASILKKLIK